MKSKIMGSIICLMLSINLIAQTKVEMKVSGECGMCKSTIHKTTKKVNGVLEYNFDLEKEILYLEVDDTSFDKLLLSNALNQVGYDTEYGKAPDEIYSDLPMCCQYRPDSNVEHNQRVDGHTNHSHSDEPSKFVSGFVVERQSDGSELALIGATIQWLDAPTGAVTDVDGSFEMGRIERTDQLVINYVGFVSDTIDVSHESEIYHVMNANLVMDEVVIKHRKNTSEISFVKPIQTIRISEEELCKAACCSLSESFETSPSIDVSFTDAVTGTRQIQMLGLSGKYVQITRELIPDVRSVGVIQGLSLTPGAWIKSIQLSKGTGSVVNGYESMTGQINLELRKPQSKEELFLNVYGNAGGRYEGNLFLREQFNENISTAILLHGASRQLRIDNNTDGFMDNPLQQNFIGINRWKYQHKNGFQAQMGVKASLINRVSGQMRYNADEDRLSDQIWGGNNETEKYEVWSKIGKVFSAEKNNSIGFQVSYTAHDQESVYGSKLYNMQHDAIFANLIYQSNLTSEKHTYKIGTSFVYDDIQEHVEGVNFVKEEKVPGAFLEYTYLPNSKFTMVAGIRADQSNYFGTQVSPRLHVRYAFNEDAVMRIIGGRGWRSPNIFAENPGYFATNRSYLIKGDNQDTPYGLGYEHAWNMGANWTQNVALGERKLTLSLDYYYTLFGNQLIPNYEYDNQSIVFEDQKGNTAGHSAQVQIDVAPIDKFDIRIAYRYNRSKAYFGEDQLDTPLNAFHKAFINLAYEAPKGWHFDYTLNWRGKQRLPNTEWLPESFRLDEFSKDYFLANAQIRKIFNEQFELYSGVENIFNFTQDNPIVDVTNPFSGNFDASLVWGPIFGRNVYFGMRYKIGS